MTVSLLIEVWRAEAKYRAAVDALADFERASETAMEGLKKHREETHEALLRAKATARKTDKTP